MSQPELQLPHASRPCPEAAAPPLEAATAAAARPAGPELDSRRLHLGCGLHSPAGWLNVDGSIQAVLARHGWLKRALVRARLLPPKQAQIPWGRNVLRLDLSRPLPLASDRFVAVYASHTLEHLYLDRARQLLRECLRVLVPGGVCRMVVPDLASFVQRYLALRARHDPAAADRLMELINAHPREAPSGLLGWYHRLCDRHTHKWMYDGESLAAAFRAAGFEQVELRGCLESRIAGIRDVEDPQRILGGEGVAVEAVKPGAPASAPGPDA